MSGAGVRKQAPRLARPAARYWKGKAPKGVVDVDSDSDAEEEQAGEEEGDIDIGGEQDFILEDNEDTESRPDAGKLPRAMNVSLKDVNISKDGKVIVAGREESGRTAMEEDGGLSINSPMDCSLSHVSQSLMSKNLKTSTSLGPQDLSHRRVHPTRRASL